jgi:exonuclease SbcC
MYSDVKEPKAPCEEPSVFLRNTAERRESELYAIYDRQSTLLASQNVLEESLSKIDAVQEEKVKLLKEFKKYEYLAKQFSGKNDSKISLENFVLHRQLEWILQNSNRFLAELTAGQYQLQLSWESLSGRRQGGLELSVLDTTRGTARASQTFSGGELFMLSLSLSLGLMVSINSVFTAADLDMLYLDEGFGTLDHTTLNRCLNLIQGLKSIKTIGIISHVQDLIEAVPQGFLVEKGIQGSVITPFKR